MKIKGKGKYDGRKNVELDKELGLPADTEIFFTIEEAKPLEQNQNKKQKKKSNGKHAFEEIAKLARPVGRSDLSVRHHEILGDLIE